MRSEKTGCLSLTLVRHLVSLQTFMCLLALLSSDSAIYTTFLFDTGLVRTWVRTVINGYVSLPYLVSCLFVGFHVFADNCIILLEFLSFIRTWCGFGTHMCQHDGNWLYKSHSILALFSLQNFIVSRTFRFY